MQQKSIIVAGYYKTHKLIIKRESFSTGVDGKFLSLEEASLWFIDPAEAMHKTLTRKKSIFLSNLFKEYDIVAFSDGSWNAQNLKAGIGGMITSKDI